MARVEGGAVIIDTDWPGLQTQIDTRNVNFKYEEDSTAYEIFAIDGQYFYKTIIYKSGQAPQNQATYDTWRADFEANYKNRVTDFNSTQPFYLSNVDGYSVVLKDGAAPTANDGYGIAIVGSDGSNYHILKADSSGRQLFVGPGTAGSPIGGIVSIQGVGGGTAIPVSGTVSVSGTITTTNASVGTTGAAILSSATQIGASDGTNLQTPRVFDADTGGGTQYILGVGLRKPSSGGSVDFGTATDPIRTDPTGSTTQPVSGTITANAGTGNFAVVQATASNLLASVGGLGPSGSATVGNPVLVAGSDGTNARSVRTASDGTVRVDPTGTTTQPVSGTVTANIGTSGSLALDATVAKLTISQSTALGSNTQALMGGSVTTAAPTYTTGNINPLSLTTAGALRIDGSGTTQPVSGTVTANAGTGNFTVVQATASNLNATVIGTTAAGSGASSGLVTVQGNASGTPIPVSGTVTATNASVSTTGSAPPGSATYMGGSVTTAAPTYTTGQMSALSLTTGGLLRIDGSGVTQPVSGTITANAGTGNFTVIQGTAANLRAQTSAESNTAASPPAQAVYVGGSVTTAAPTYTTGQMNALSLTTAGALRIDGSGSTQPVSGTVAATQSGTWTVQPGNTANTTPWLTTISQGGNSATVSAGGALKIDGSAVTQPVSGTVTANIGTSGSLALDATLAKLTIAQSAALGSNTQAMVGGSVTTAAPTYTTGNINPLSLTTAGALRTDASGTTQPISGTITANIGTSGSLALDATLTGGTQTTRITDGTNTATVKAASTAAVATDKALVVAISPNNTVAVTGTVTATNPSVSTTGSAPPASATYMGASVTTAAPSYTTGQMSALSLTTGGLLRIDGSGVTQPISGTVATTQSGTWTVQPGNTANTTPWLATISQGGNSATVSAGGALKVDGSAVTQPVSGTVTANIGTTNGLALDATLTKLTIAQSAALGANTQAMVGGSVTTAAPTYTTGNINPLSLTTAGALRIDGSGTTQPVSGTVTANAGTGNFTVVQATAANLNATVVGTTAAGSGAASGLVTVQGNASGTPIPVSGTVTATNASVSTTGTAPPASATYIGGSVTTAAPTYTTGQMSALSLTTGGLLRIDGSGATQPVSGTITANAGTGNFTVVQATAANLRAQIASESATGAATPATAGLAGGAVTTAAPTYTTGNLGALSLTTAGSLRIDGSGSTQPVSGTVAATQSGTWTVQPGNTANTTPWLTTISQGGNAATVSAGGALKVDGSAVTQPVSGTITANIGTSGSLALDATLSAQSLVDNAAFTDGTSRVVPAGYIFDEVAGTALTENDVAASRIDSKRAQILVIEDATTRGQRLTITASNAMKVDGSAVTQPVSGTITANAGTGNFTVIGTGTDNTANSTAKLPILAALANTSAPTWTNGNMAPLSVDTTGALRITGSISATNPSVSTTGTAPPASATYIGGSVTTAAPSYTTGQMSALSLTTSGLLRIDGSGSTQPVSGTITANIGTSGSLALDATLAKLTIAQSAALGANTQAMVGGSVTTAAPTYTTGNINPLSLTTAGALRIDGSGSTQPVSGTVTANAGTGNFTVVQATAANLRAQTSSESNTAAAPPTQASYTGGSVTTAAPSYTTGQMNALSLTTAGGLRVDGSGTTQPVSGTVTANIGTSGSLALDATLSAQSLVDNAGFTDGTSRVVPAGYILDEVAGTALTENDVAASRIDSKRAQVMVIEDATTRGQRVTVKAASTAAVATDTALVVALSPNNPITTTPAGDTTASGTLGALNAAVTISMAGQGAVGMFLAAGTLVGTITPELSFDAGTTWVSTFFDDPATGNKTSTIVFGVSNTATTRTIVGAGGTSNARVRVSAYTSGTATGNLRANNVDDPSTLSTGAIGTATPPVSVAIAGNDGSVMRNILTDTSGRSIIVGSVADRGSMTPGTQVGVPIIGQSSNVGRIIRTDRMGSISQPNKTLLALDQVEGSTINSYLWTTANATMSISQSTGILTLNSNVQTSTTIYAIITGGRLLPIVNQAPISSSFRALVTLTTNATAELGIGAPTTTTAIINNGSFFRISNSGQVKAVISYNGTETVSGVLATLTSTSYYLFIVVLEDNGTRFIVEDANGIPAVDTFIPLGLTIPDKAAATHLPPFARVYTTGVAGVAPQIKISSFQAWQLDVNTSRPWSDQMSNVGRVSGISPTAFGQTGNMNNSAAPTIVTPLNTTSSYTSLGGEYRINGTASSESMLGVFGFQVPTPYQLIITGFNMHPPVVATALGATINIQEWAIMIASSASPFSAGGWIYPVGMFSAAASAVAGTVYSGQTVNINFTTPITVQPGLFVLIMVKVISGSAAGVYRGTCLVNGYFE